MDALALFPSAPPLREAVTGIWLAAWLISEASFVAYAVSRRSSRSTARRGDRGSGAVLFLAVWAAIVINLSTSSRGLGPILSVWAIVPGSILLALGLSIRGWAIWTLGREFSYVVRTTEDQQLVDRGPYAILRHPAYAGSLLTILGFAVLVGSLVGLGATVLVVGPAFLYRIRVEEIALRGRFPNQYEAYAKRTWRLLPGVY